MSKYIRNEVIVISSAEIADINNMSMTLKQKRDKYHELTKRDAKHFKTNESITRALLDVRQHMIDSFVEAFSELDVARVDESRKHLSCSMCASSSCLQFVSVSKSTLKQTVRVYCLCCASAQRNLRQRFERKFDIKKSEADVRIASCLARFEELLEAKLSDTSDSDTSK